MNGSRDWWRSKALVVALVAGATGCCLVLPPLAAFEPQRLLALALVFAGTALHASGMILRVRGTGETSLAPTLAQANSPSTPCGTQRRSGAPLPVGEGVGGEVQTGEGCLAPTAASITGIAILWGVIAWCALSQAAPLTASLPQVWSARALPLVLLLAGWLWLRLPQEWQRRGLLGVALPSLVALGIAAWPGPPRLANFSPYYLAVDSHDTLYVSDAHAAVIRVFAPDGSLVAKLRPGLASRQGPPGPGFSPPGPYNDPDRLGVARATPGANGVSAPLQPWPVGADDFWFCGMAIGPHDRLFVPDWMRARMLRFAPDGRLEASWPLPQGYQPPLGCVTATASALYLADTRGSIERIDPQTGRVLTTWTLGEPILGGISATPSGEVYALAHTRVYRLDPHANSANGAIDSWPLPAPLGALGAPYQAILALGNERVLVANLAAHHVDIYSSGGKAQGALGGPGSMPGQFGQVGGLATDGDGGLYVADSDARAVQRFTTAGHIHALYWSPDDDEIE